MLSYPIKLVFVLVIDSQRMWWGRERKPWQRVAKAEKHHTGLERFPSDPTGDCADVVYVLQQEKGNTKEEEQEVSKLGIRTEPLKVRIFQWATARTIRWMRKAYTTQTYHCGSFLCQRTKKETVQPCSHQQRREDGPWPQNLNCHCYYRKTQTLSVWIALLHSADKCNTVPTVTSYY